MKLRILFIFLVLFNTPLTASLYESESFSKQLVKRTAPLTKTSLAKALRSFKEICQNQSYPLPKGYTLKHPNMYFEAESCTPYYYTGSRALSNMTRRDTQLSIVVPVMEEEVYTQQTVGQILVMEYPQQDSKKFSLHFITISDEYQKKGLGGTALDLTIILAQFLSQKSRFYDHLTLQCADYDGDIYLGNVPYRLSYYLNHGFLIDPETVSYMRHLDFSYFIHSMDLDNFNSFLSSYSDGNYGTENFPLNSFKDQAELILTTLKERYPLQAEGLDERCLQIAENSSSHAGKRILDRLFYDGSLSDEFYEGQIESKIYVMNLEVKNWVFNLLARQTLQKKRSLSFAKYTYDHNELNFLLGKISQLHTYFSEPVEPEEEVKPKKHPLNMSLTITLKKKKSKSKPLSSTQKKAFESLVIKKYNSGETFFESLNI